MPRFRICGLVSSETIRWGTSLRIELESPERPTDQEAMKPLRRAALLALRCGLGTDAMSMTAEEVEALRYPHEVYLESIDDLAFTVAARRAAFARGFFSQGPAVRHSVDGLLDEEQAERLGAWAAALAPLLQAPVEIDRLRSGHGSVHRWDPPEWPPLEAEPVRQALRAFLAAVGDRSTPAAEILEVGRRALHAAAAAYEAGPELLALLPR